MSETYRGDKWLADQVEKFLKTGVYEDHSVFHEIVHRLRGLKEGMKIRFCCGSMEECFTLKTDDGNSRERFAHFVHTTDGIVVAGFEYDLGNGDECPYCHQKIEIIGAEQ